MRTDHAGAWLAVALLVLAPAGYVGTYLALLEPVGMGSCLGQVIATRQVPHYRVGGGLPGLIFAHRVFAPLEWLDHRIRSDYWDEKHEWVMEIMAGRLEEEPDPAIKEKYEKELLEGLLEPKKK
jgi:hypothetical protein